jgi:hypothetical protein
MNSTQRHYANRMRGLIDEGKKIETLVRTPAQRSSPGVMALSLPDVEDKARLNAWLINSKNIIEIVFSNTSIQFKRFEELTKSDICHSKSQISSIVGLLIGSLNDLENGFLIGQEFLIAGEVFDSLLDEAKYLLKYGHIQAAAVLGRVVLEDALKRLARAENIDDTQKADAINTSLRIKERYNLSQENLIKAYLATGNSAAHNKLQTYKKEEVTEQINGIERFIANHFQV